MSALKQEYAKNGIISRCFELSDLAPLPGLLADASHFEREVAKMRQQDQYSVPYDVTDSIFSVAHDPDLIKVVTEILDTPDWVMWGANVRSGTPNEAHRWHVDIESVFWPSITVAIGVSGCVAANATRVLPGSHSFPIPALEAVDASDDVAVMGAARDCDSTIQESLTADGFADGRFFAFDARAWHSGVPHQSNDRCVLFMHYQRADALRVPQLKDYRRGTFYRYPAAFIDGTGRANTRLAAGPYVGRLERLALRFGL